MPHEDLSGIFPGIFSGAAMKESAVLLIFILDAQRYALPLPDVDRVVRMATVTPLPKAPGIVLGVINIQGRVIPIINMRQRFCLPDKEIALTDQLIVAHTRRRSVALVADAVQDVAGYPAQSIVPAEHIVPGAEYVQGVIKLEDGLVLIHDLDKFLSLEEENFLDRALATC